MENTKNTNINLLNANFFLSLRSLINKSFTFKRSRDKMSLVNILTYMYIKEHDNSQVTVTSASYCTDLPKTTAMRRISSLKDQSYIEEYKDCRDERCIYIYLSQKAKNELTNFFERLENMRYNDKKLHDSSYKYINKDYPNTLY